MTLLLCYIYHITLTKGDFLLKIVVHSIKVGGNDEEEFAVNCFAFSNNNHI